MNVLLIASDNLYLTPYYRLYEKILIEKAMDYGVLYWDKNGNEAAANTLREMILKTFPRVDVQIHICRGLCSYYAEKGGMLVGFEKM